MEPESLNDGPSLEVRKDILETAKMLILEQQRSDSTGDAASGFDERFQALESKINQILSIINKSEE